METFGCMYADVGCKSMERLGAKYAVVGCKVCGICRVHVCGCWVHLCGNGWVQSMRLLGACMRKRLGACMWLLGACMRLLGASFITAESLPDSR